MIFSYMKAKMIYKIIANLYLNFTANKKTLHPIINKKDRHTHWAADLFGILYSKMKLLGLAVDIEFGRVDAWFLLEEVFAVSHWS